jgi:tripartite-type tricarboxylate transporter receptor subunit TctC
VLAAPAVRERLVQLGFEIDGRGAAQYAAFIRSEAERWTPIIRAIGAKAD